MKWTWFTESRLFDLARQGQRLTHIGLVIPFSFLFALLSQLGAIPLFLVMSRIYGMTNSGIDMQNASALEAGFWMGLQLIFSFALIYLILWAWLKFFEKRPFHTMGFEAGDALNKYVRGFFFGLLMFGGSVAILALTGSVAFENGDPAKQGAAALGGVVLVLAGWLVQGAAEEVLIRGWALPVIGARYKPWVGLLVSSLIFSLLHGLNPGLSAIALVNLALFGVFAGLYAIREGSLWGICAIHSVWNWVQGNFFGFEVSGTEAGGGTLLNLMETGADWLTGGPFGPEGGLAVTIVLMISIGLVMFWKHKPAE